MAAPDAPSIAQNSLKSELRPEAMDLRFETRSQEIAMEAAKLKESLFDVIIRTLRFRARKRLGLLIVRLRKIRVAGMCVMLIRNEGSLEETGPVMVIPEELLPVKTG
jgi:hypothetical protein